MRRLIVNADGFGFTFGNNRAILEVLRHGFIRSVSVNVTWPAVKEVPLLVRNFPEVSIGVHLNLSVGPPVLPPAEIPSLVGQDGLFHGSDFIRRARKHLLDVGEMKRELRAQIGVLRDLGAGITHWDSHQGRHMYPGFFRAAVEVAVEEGIPASRSHNYFLILPRGGRMMGRLRYYLRNPRRIISHRVSAARTRAVRRAGIRLADYRLVMVPLGPGAVYRPECWQLLLEQVPEGLSFVECHPGYVDEDLRRYSTMLESRERERELFDDPHWLERAAQVGVEVVSCHVLAAGAEPPGG